MSALHGKTVLVTRPHEQSQGLVGELIALGAIPVLYPAIESLLQKIQAE